MKKYLLLLAILVGLNTQTFGFATVVSAFKGGDEIIFNSNQSDSFVFLDGQKIGVVSGNTFKYKLKRDGQGHTFTFKKEGFKDVTLSVSTKFDNLFWGNVLFGGTLGSSTDSWSTNGTREFTPNQFYVDMIKG